MSNMVVSQASALAKKLSLDADPVDLVKVLKATAFQGDVSDSQMAALMVVANQYGLNPWTKEIYAFPDKKNGIVPVVGVDGWSRIINSHPMFDGMEYRYSEEMVTPKGAKSKCHAWVECVIFRKDRDHPIAVREYLDEAYRPPFEREGRNGAYTIDGPWQTHPKRFLRHKATIQCARLAFGFVGIYEQDEAERIIEAQAVDVVHPERPERPPYPADDFARHLPTWRQAIESGRRTADEIVTMVSTKGVLSPEQEAAIRAEPEIVDVDVVEVAA